MNKIKIDLPELLQANAFIVWFEKEGFELFQKFYSEKMPDEIQPEEMFTEYDNFYITIE